MQPLCSHGPDVWREAEVWRIMRVTRESLIRIAKETAQERAFNDQDIIAAYLTGSLVSDTDPLLGGTADIDLIFVRASEPKHRREFVKLTPDFHLDISHRPKAEFKRPRELRLDPWLGWETVSYTHLTLPTILRV